MAIEHCQNLVIGSGEPGKYLAWTLAKQGQKTVVVERSMVGGSCPNVACLPSKNIIHSAEAAWLVARVAEFGVQTGPSRVDMAGVIRRKKAMIDGLAELHRTLFDGSGAALVMGEARFTEPKTVLVTLTAGGTRQLRGERVFLAVGTRAAVPDVPGLLEAGAMTHVQALELQRLPGHVAVLGGGYIGLEFAQAMRRFGSRVTIIQRGGQLLGREDLDVADELLQLMKDEGVDVLLNTEVLKVEGRSGQDVRLHLRSGPQTTVVQATDVLVATGRTPNSDRLDAHKAGVELDAHGYVRVDDKLRTTAPDVWAMGECAGSPQFTHVGFDDFRVVRDNLAGIERSTRGRLVPFCLYTDPQVARVGLSEGEAKRAGVPARVAKLPINLVLRSRTTGQTRGFMKALVGADHDRVLGFTMVGSQAGEVLAAVQTAMLAGLPYTVLRDAILTHPTMAEGLGPLFSRVPPLSAPLSTGTQSESAERHQPSPIGPKG